MHNTNFYQTDLMIYVFTVLLIALVLFVIGNLILLILKLTKVFNEKSVWILGNVVGVLIVAASIIPAIIDIERESYCSIPDVVKIEEYSANNADKYLLITDKNGEVHTCLSFLIDTESLQNVTYPGTVIYAKHSELMLDYIPTE